MTSFIKPHLTVKPRQLTLIVVIIALIVLPLLKIVSLVNVSDLNYVLKDIEIKEAIRNSFLITVLVVLTTIPLSFACAFCIVRTNIKFKTVFSALCVLPLFLPPISFGYSLLSIFGKNGFIFYLFNIRLPLMGFLGIYLGLVLYTFPVAFLILKNALQKSNIVVYESAVLLGIPPHRFFLNVTLPLLWKPIVSAIFAAIIMSLTEYGVCLIVGGKVKTVSLLIYRQVLGALDISKGVALGSLLLLPLLLLLFFDVRTPQINEGIIYKSYIAPESNNVSTRKK